MLEQFLQLVCLQGSAIQICVGEKIKNHQNVMILEYHLLLVKLKSNYVRSIFSLVSKDNFVLHFHAQSRKCPYQVGKINPK